MSISIDFDAGPRRAARNALALASGLLALALASPPSVFAQAATETECTDGKDNDGDTVYDCGDADCYENPACAPDGNPESTNQRCSDWIDNDEDGYTDCDDRDCEDVNITACLGSWQVQKLAAKKAKEDADSGDSGDNNASTPDGDIPELLPGMAVEDLIGKGGDKDGERNNIVCSDGVDNDNDGRTDCADFGCRFDPTVTICQGDPDFRFSAVARAEHTFNFEEPNRPIDPDTMQEKEGIIQDTRFSRLQLRVFGPLPLVADSFYLLSMRVEKTPRMTFALFQIPVNKRGHYLNLNSGSGGLSWALVRSAHKRLLLEAPFYLYNAFEQGTGAALEFGGPIDTKSRLMFRTFISGGTGTFNGNVGGAFVGEDDSNYAYTLGGQVHWNAIGYYSRWDSPMLYTESPLTFAILAGAKYDQRPRERYPAFNVSSVLRYRRLIVLGEMYHKYVLDWKFWQHAYNIQLGVLAIPKRLLIAADFGEYVVPDAPDEFDNDFDQETQWRVAAHVYLWRNVLTGSVLYVDRREDSPDPTQGDQVTRELKFVGQYRF